MNELVIETSQLTKSFDGLQVLKPLDLKVPRNSIFGFLGPNGAGKSTTMKLLLGLIRPTAGSGRIFGLDIQSDGLEIRRRIGYLSQDARYYDYMTARQTLRYAARFFYTGTKAGIEARIAEMLELVGLADKADRPIKGFSGGERQRLGIAQAQINYPDLLILDEPAAALDPLGRHDVLEVMASLREHTTIFYSTHILDDVQKVSDTVAILNGGELVAQAPIGELLAGKEGTVYALSLTGDPERARERLSAEPWVSEITSVSDNGLHCWQVAVSDDAVAEHQLLRLVLQDSEVDVVKFSRQTFELEDVFMRLVGGQA